jgi:hypothetical protein
MAEAAGCTMSAHMRNHAKQLVASKGIRATSTALSWWLIHCCCCRLNSAQEADDPTLQASLLQLVQQLAAVNPTARPAESDLINGR